MFQVLLNNIKSGPFCIFHQVKDEEEKMQISCKFLSKAMSSKQIDRKGGRSNNHGGIHKYKQATILGNFICGIKHIAKTTTNEDIL